jgi:chitinase
VAAWNSTTAYNGGQQVSRVCGGTTNLYTAAFWTQGNDPCTSSGGAGSGQPWIPNGACGPTPTSGPTPTAGPTAPPGAVNLHHALYLMPFNNPIPIQQYINETGLKSYMISFVLSNGGCTAAWDGTQPINSSTVSSMINTIRSNGGDIAISQGGYGGTKLGQACASGTAAYNAMKAVVNMYSVKAVDFDIEEPEIENDTHVSNELDAANLFANDGLQVSITLPTLTSGPNYFGGLTLDKAVAKGMCGKANIHWRVMPFDGGFTQPGSTQTALQGLHDMIMTKCAWSDATAWSRLGVSGMIGRDDTGSFTSLSAWNTIVSFAKSKGMPDITTWAQQRDRPCTPLYGQVDPGTKGDCSSVTDPEGAFGKTLVN